MLQGRRTRQHMMRKLLLARVQGIDAAPQRVARPGLGHVAEPCPPGSHEPVGRQLDLEQRPSRDLHLDDGQACGVAGRAVGGALVVAGDVGGGVARAASLGQEARRRLDDQVMDGVEAVAEQVVERVGPGVVGLVDPHPAGQRDAAPAHAVGRVQPVQPRVGRQLEPIALVPGPGKHLRPSRKAATHRAAAAAKVDPHPVAARLVASILRQHRARQVRDQVVAVAKVKLLELGRTNDRVAQVRALQHLEPRQAEVEAIQGVAAEGDGLAPGRQVEGVSALATVHRGQRGPTGGALQQIIGDTGVDPERVVTPAEPDVLEVVGVVDAPSRQGHLQAPGWRAFVGGAARVLDLLDFHVELL